MDKFCVSVLYYFIWSVKYVRLYIIFVIFFHAMSCQSNDKLHQNKARKECMRVSLAVFPAVFTYFSAKFPG